ncbi:hypothetical protein [Desulfocurvus vexinensis]|uniref:hypothetical protein n=1 Tax=Desulfocurvus vexinensis TaxID=399548 RepID=UPI0004B1F542|nr:hypothetical protein [Desulfocurvus vexinensis]
MSRQPIDRQAAQGAPRGQAYMWAVMMALAEFTISDVADRTNAGRDTVRDYVVRLERGGYLARTGLRGEGRYEAVVYRVDRKCREYPRLRKDGTECPPTKRESMWRSMRMLGEFGYRDLTVTASTAATPVADIDAKDYLKHLYRAGYLKVTAPAHGNRPARYRLIRNTGPKPPKVQRIRQVFDPNLNEVVWSQGGER